MAEEESGMGTGMVLLSFLVGAALGSSLVLLLKQNESEDQESSSEDGPLFI
ncbi:hypothetical protein OR1_03029 [Geobacter sp. OR-1]|uniref:hypothetical protein n=1 Tax=Geobacter sp. OR-1 TaxID=1266765 RepID=UPI0005439F9B|nr:hypothetical protein [Geobacter sp. OR-1]GAM10735.1 hypothetical protein OR1_03029 [Geobacter sp. OR-1]